MSLTCYSPLNETTVRQESAHSHSLPIGHEKTMDETVAKADKIHNTVTHSLFIVQDCMRLPSRTCSVAHKLLLVMRQNLQQ